MDTICMQGRTRRLRHPDPHWRTVAPAPPRQRGGLARGRVPFDRRAQVLPLELADRDAAKNPRRHDQGALALRAGPSYQLGGEPSNELCGRCPSSTPAGRSRQPRTNTRKCGDQPAHQSLLTVVLTVLSPALRSRCILPNPFVQRDRTPASLTTNIRVMRDNWPSNRVFASYTDLVDHCCEAWNKLIERPWTIMSICLRDWANGF